MRTALATVVASEFLIVWRRVRTPAVFSAYALHRRRELLG